MGWVWVDDDFDLDNEIKSWDRTCDACPTQYEIELRDGRHIYFRYRHGGWRIDLDGVNVASGEINQMADGFLTHDEVWALLERQLPAVL